jgi:predicted transposase YdaD
VEFNPYDVSAKELVWDGPANWLKRLSIPLPGPVDVIDSDITALTAAADKVIKVGGSEPFLVNLEFQSSHQGDLVETLWFRQAALYHRHRLPVLTVLILLRREANSPGFKGTFEILMPDSYRTNLYNYRIVRVWNEDPESYLTAEVNLVPLAPLADVPEDALPGSEEVASRLLEGVQNMRESTTYQAILREGVNKGLFEGRVSEARRLLVLLGEDRFGAPDEATRTAIEAIRDLERLERMSRRTHDPNIHDWADLLDTP